ncbi:MAG: lysylphosphatidylglycerol synthase transmembrane domain-containing protein [Gaiellaceae bacterium]
MSSRARGRRAKWGSAALALAVTVGLGYLAVRDVDLDELGESLREMNYWWLLPGLATLALGFFMRALRWRLLFTPSKRPAVWPTTEALLIGQFLNSVLPLRAGDAARIVALHPLAGTSRAVTTGTVVTERFFDVLSLLLLLFVALPWLPELGWLRAAGLLAIALTLAAVAAAVVLRVYGERPLRFLLRPLARLPFLSVKRVEDAVRNLTRGLAGLRSARLGLVAFLWTIASWLVLGVSFWLVMLGFDLGLSPAAGLLVVIATGLSMILPSAPAAVGVFEAAVVVALSAYGISQSEALSYALVVHALNVLPFVVAGLVVLNVRRDVLSLSGRPRGGGERPGPPAGAGPARLRAGTRRDRSRTGDHEHDVPQPADRHAEVDEVREPR